MSYEKGRKCQGNGGMQLVTPSHVSMLIKALKVLLGGRYNRQLIMLACYVMVLVNHLSKSRGDPFLLLTGPLIFWRAAGYSFFFLLGAVTRLLFIVFSEDPI